MSDAGSEYLKSNAFDQALLKKGIIINQSAPWTPAERLMHTLMDKAKAMWHQACIPQSWWGFAFAHVTFHPYSFPSDFLSSTIIASHYPVGCVDMLFPHSFFWLCQTCTIPVSSCASAMLTCVQLCLWQPIAFLPFTSCSARCLSEAIRTCHDRFLSPRSCWGFSPCSYSRFDLYYPTEVLVNARAFFCGNARAFLLTQINS